MRGSRLTSGRLCPSSHFDTAAFETPRWAASASWVTPARRRSRAIVRPMLTVSFMMCSSQSPNAWVVRLASDIPSVESTADKIKGAPVDLWRQPSTSPRRGCRKPSGAALAPAVELADDSRNATAWRNFRYTVSPGYRGRIQTGFFPILKKVVALQLELVGSTGDRHHERTVFPHTDHNDGAVLVYSPAVQGPTAQTPLRATAMQAVAPTRRQATSLNHVPRMPHISASE